MMSENENQGNSLSFEGTHFEAGFNVTACGRMVDLLEPERRTAERDKVTCQICLSVLARQATRKKQEVEDRNTA